MASVFKRGKDKKRAGTKWLFTYIDEHGKRTSPRVGFTDRRATEDHARKLEERAKQIAAGHIDPRAEKRAADARQPIAVHVERFASHLAAKGGTQNHVERTRRTVEAAIAAADWTTVLQVDCEPAAAYLKAMRDRGVAARTINRHRQCLRAFTRWLHREGILLSDPLLRLPAQNEQVDRRVNRRAMDDGEIILLLQTTEAAPKRHGLSGRDRAMLYRTALGTGFRAGELQSLTDASFALDSEPPTVTVAAAYSKRRRQDVQPIRQDLAEALRPWLAESPQERPLWPKLNRTAEMFRADLRLARACWIRSTPNRAERRQRRSSAFLAVEDPAGRVLDFHALRHTFITRIVRAGVKPKVAQQLARHSTITLTMDRYTHLGLADDVAALDALPSLEETVPAELAATGTDGRAQRRAQRATRTGAHPGASVCHLGPRAVRPGIVENAAENRDSGRSRLTIASQRARGGTADAGDLKS